jgi:hypothetical protein
MVSQPLYLLGQQARVTVIETTGAEYKREHFSYADTLLAEVRTYNKEDKIVKWLRFTYDESNVLVRVSKTEGPQRQEWLIRYANGQVEEISQVDNNEPQGFAFTYDLAGELKSIKLIGHVNGTWDYIFAGGNLRSITFNMPPDFPLTARNKTYTAYDNHVNYWSLIGKSTTKHRVILATFFDDDSWSRNNPLHSSMDRQDGESITQYQYEYDSLGNPVRITVKATGVPDEILKLTYTMK